MMWMVRVAYDEEDGNGCDEQDEEERIMLMVRRQMMVKKQMMLGMRKRTDVGDGLAQHHLEEVWGALTPGQHQYSLLLTNVHLSTMFTLVQMWPRPPMFTCVIRCLLFLHAYTSVHC